MRTAVAAVVLLAVVGCWKGSPKPSDPVPVGPSAAAPSRPNPADPDKEAKEEFFQVIRQNAADPTGFEIVKWPQRQGNLRSPVVFRCKLIGLSAPRNLGGGFVPSKGGEPVMLDDATISYRPDGRIEEVSLDKMYSIWRHK